MSWFVVWLVSTIPVLLFQVGFDTSNYSLLVQMLLGEFTLYGYLIFMAFGFSERISLRIGLLGSQRKKQEMVSVSEIAKECPELTLITFNDHN